MYVRIKIKQWPQPSRCSPLYRASQVAGINAEFFMKGTNAFSMQAALCEVEYRWSGDVVVKGKCGYDAPSVTHFSWLERSV